MFTIATDAMSNATITTSINPTYVDLKDDYMTEQEWHEECRKHKNTRKDLVRLWFLNKFGSTRACASHLQCHQATVIRDAKQLVEMGELTAEHYELQPSKATKKKPAPVFTGFAKDKAAAKCSTPVENSSTTVCSQSSRHDQPSHTEPSIRSSVQVVQPIVDTYSDGQDERVVSMGTASDRDWEQAVAHLQALRQFTHDYFDPNGPISEQQWEQFHAECHDLAYFARMRCSNLRQRNEQAAHAILGAVFNDGDSSVQEE